MYGELLMYHVNTEGNFKMLCEMFFLISETISGCLFMMDEGVGVEIKSV